MNRGPVLARRVFRVAGIYGIVALAPQYLLEKQVGRDFPPAITHPEFFFGFIGVALAWQFVFLLIAGDPVRYRPLMPAAVVEKLVFAVAAPVLYLQGRAAAAVAIFGAIDLLLAILFTLSFRATASVPRGRAAVDGPGVVFARRLFTVAAVVAILALVPMYFLEEKLGRDFPPPITHPEHFYGFVGVALAWQIAFLVMARDPLRYRPVMIPAAVEKLLVGGPALILYLQGRLAAMTFSLLAADLLFAVLFAVAYRMTRPR